MKNNLLVILIILMVSMVGCGKEAVIATNGTIEPELTESVNNISEDSEKAEEKIETSSEDEYADSSVTNEDIASLNLKEYEYSFEDRTVDTSGKPVFPFLEMEDCRNVFYLTDSINLYIDNGSCIGYTKPNIEIVTIMEYDGWYYIDLAGKARYVKAEDVEKKGFAGSKQDYVDATTVKEVANDKPEQETASTVTPDGNIPVESTPVETSEPVQESDKYTPEEAISVYRGLMEAGGITWAPELKGVTSWGTGWIYLDKGYPEWCASTDLESFAMGDSGGNPWTKYYLEVTGSDENAVYITEWHN